MHSMNLVLRWWFLGLFTTAISWSQDETGVNVAKDKPGVSIKETHLYGIGYGKKYHAGVPCDGEHQLIDELGKVILDLDDFSSISMSNIRLKELIHLLNQKIPTTSPWKLQASNEAGEVKVTGLIDRHLMMTLVDFMKNGQVYCHVTEGLVMFRMSSNTNLDPVESDVSEITGADEPVMKTADQLIQEPAKDLKKMVILTKNFGPKYHSDGMGYCGDGGLYSQVALVKLTAVDHAAINQITLLELASRLNSAVTEPKKWRFTVEDKIKQLRVSGALDEDLLKCLGYFMDSAAFHCRVTEGEVKFVSGSGGMMGKSETKKLPAGLYRR
jgi:hypothetical protein